MKKLLPFLLLLCLSVQGWAQGNIPLGSWRTHFSYAQVQELELAGSRVYAASDNGFFYFDKAANEIVTLGPQQGFSDVGVSTLGWQAQQQLLLVGYGSGKIDLLQNGDITTISTIQEATLAGSKRLNEVVFRGDSAIIATDFGISIIDLGQGRLLDSYLNLGPQGQRVAVYDVAVLNDTLYAVTEAGLISNRLNRRNNPGDFAGWRRWGLEQGVPSTGISHVEVLGGQVWVADNGTLFRKNGSSWLPVQLREQESITDLQASEAAGVLVVSTDAAVYQFNPGQNTFLAYRHELLQDPLTAVLDRDGSYWIGDGYNGLLTNREGSLSRRIPDGPLSDDVEQLQYANGQVVALYGGYRDFDIPLGTSGFSVFTTADGWINYHPLQRAGSRLMPAVQDLNAAAYHPGRKEWYFASFSDGLLAWRPLEDAFVHYTAGTPGVSLLEARNSPGKVLLSGVGVDPTGDVWVSSFNSTVPLHRFTPSSGAWQGFLTNNYAASLAEELLVPFTGDVWLRLRPGRNNAEGILVVNPEKQPGIRSLSRSSGSGGLVSNQVYALQEDLEGNVWVGTSDGLSYFPTPGAVLSANEINAALPIFQQRPLLDESLITTIAVDGGNRKWIGTTSGVWVFGDAGDTLYHHFTTANSPLPSNTIKAITVHQQTGEVFIATDKGLVSYRSGATEGGATHADAIKIFPNPVLPGYTGQVAITGLVQDAVVKITDTAGFLVRELYAEGGTASWDLQDSRGGRVASGVYLVFSANAAGTEALVGKVAVVR